MKHKITIESEATPEEVAELIKRVGSNWADAATELATNSSDQLIINWPKSIEDFWRSFGTWSN